MWIKSSIALCEKTLFFTMFSLWALWRAGAELGRAGATWSELERPGPSRGELGAIQGELGRSRAQEIKEPYTYTLIGSALQGNSR